MSPTLFIRSKWKVLSYSLLVTVLFIVSFHLLGRDLHDPRVLLEAILNGGIFSVVVAYIFQKHSEVTLKPTWTGLLKAVLIGIVMLPILFLITIAIAYVLSLFRTCFYS